MVKQAAKKLMTHNRSFVVVESNKEIIDKHQNEDILFVLGNANEDEVLQWQQELNAPSV